MQRPAPLDRLDVELTSTMEKPQGVADGQSPFRILVLGDFSGRRNRGLIEPLGARRPVFVDRDNLDEVLRKTGVKISLDVVGKDAPPVVIGCAGLEDFHPDRLYERIEVFSALRDTREGLADPSTFAALAGAWQGAVTPPASPAPATPSPPPASVERPGDFLDRVLDATGERPSSASASEGAADWDKFMRQITAPHLEPKPHPQQREIIAAVDAATGELMRRVLHHPEFQALEAAWRGLHFLVSRVETNEQLTLYLLDLSKEELAADLLASDDLTHTDLYTLLVEEAAQTPGAEPWAFVAGLYAFDQTIDDAHVLAGVSMIARAAGAPFVAAAHPRLVGCTSLAETPDPARWRWLPDEDARSAWDALRDMPEAGFLGLCLPRFLLRLPYGAETDPIGSFEFEEMPGVPKHEDYLWGNPAFACACLVAHAFTESGWDLQPGDVLDIAELPLHVYKEHGASRATPCAEALLTVQAAEVILGRGVMPLLSFKDQDRVRLARFQSLAEPPASLRGRWAGDVM